MGVVEGVHTGEVRSLESGQACPLHLPSGVRWKRVNTRVCPSLLLIRVKCPRPLPPPVPKRRLSQRQEKNREIGR